MKESYLPGPWVWEYIDHPQYVEENKTPAWIISSISDEFVPEEAGDEHNDTDKWPQTVLVIHDIKGVVTPSVFDLALICAAPNLLRLVELALWREIALTTDPESPYSTDTALVVDYCKAIAEAKRH